MSNSESESRFTIQVKPGPHLKERANMAKRPPNDGKHWTQENVRELKKLADQNTPTRVIGLKTGRSPAAVYAKASDEGISLKPTNQSPYGKQKYSY